MNKRHLSTSSAFVDVEERNIEEIDTNVIRVLMMFDVLLKIKDPSSKR